MPTGLVSLCLSCLLGAGPGPLEADPFIGTAGHGHTYPGATLPFGAVQLSPDTRLEPGDWDGCSGYHLGDPVIHGFSHLHLSGTGASDGCDLLFSPHTGEPRLGNGRDGRPGYGSAYDRASERAEPGYYAVTLKDYRIRAELTATAHCGVHRYACPRWEPARLTVDLAHRDPVLASRLAFTGDRELDGRIRPGLDAAAAWRDQLGRITVEGGAPEQRTAFYTALYHASLAPTRSRTWTAATWGGTSRCTPATARPTTPPSPCGIPTGPSTRC